MSVCTYYSSVWVHGQTLLLHLLFFSGMTGLPQETLREADSPEELSPYGSPLRGPPGPWTFSDYWTSWGFPHTKKVLSKNWETYNLGARSTLFASFQRIQQLQNTGRAGFLNSPGDFCCLGSPLCATAILRVQYICREALLRARRYAYWLIRTWGNTWLL